MSEARALLRAGNIGGCNPGDSSCQHRIPPSRRGRNVRMSEARALLRAGNIGGCNLGDSSCQHRIPLLGEAGM